MARELVHMCECGHVHHAVLEDPAVGLAWKCPKCGIENVSFHTKPIPKSPCEVCDWKCSQCKLTKRQTT